MDVDGRGGGERREETILEVGWAIMRMYLRLLSRALKMVEKASFIF